jgi:hypothetical protein
MHNRKHEIILILMIIAAFIGYNQYRNNAIQESKSITEGLISASNMKHEISNYYMMSNTFPNNNTDLNLPDYTPPPNSPILSLDIIQGGIIQVTYNKASGFRNQTIQLIPNSSNGAYMIYWTCVTSSKKIASNVPSCEYLP